MAGMRNFLEGPGGKLVAGVLVLVAAVAVFLAVRSVTGVNEAAAIANERIFVDAKTGKAFKVTLKPGLDYPVEAPSGGKTGYPAELCYWTKDGQVKTEPTAVLLNIATGNQDPTFCPDCGRLVVGHNPRPQPGDKPPPTAAEYKSRRGTQSEER